MDNLNWQIRLKNAIIIFKVVHITTNEIGIGNVMEISSINLNSCLR